MTPGRCLSPRDRDDERFVYVATAAGVEGLREGAASFDSEREAARDTGLIALDAITSRAKD